MTPQLMQAIKLLQMSNLDLVAYVEAELERNPLLEKGDGDNSESGAAAEAGPDADTDSRSANAEQAGSSGEEPDSGDWMQSDLETGSEAIAARMDTESRQCFPG